MLYYEVLDKTTLGLLTELFQKPVLGEARLVGGTSL